MNFGRLGAAALVSWLVHLAVSAFTWGTLLPDVVRQSATLLRPAAEMNVVLGYAGSLVGFFAFAYAYAKGYEGGSGAAEGLRYGVLVGLLLAAFGVSWAYVMLPLTRGFAAALVLDCIIEMAVYGVVVGSIYRPAAIRRPR